MRKLLNSLTGLALAVLMANASAQPLPPVFDAYPINEQYSSETARLVLTNKQDHEFQSQLRRAIKQRPNFAGPIY